MIVQTLLGASAEPAHLTAAEVFGRGLVIAVIPLLMVRFAARRFLPQAAPFALALGVILGWALSRTANGPSAIIPTIAGVIVLLVIQQLASRITFRQRRLTDFLKDSTATAAGDRRQDDLAGVKDAAMVTLEPGGRFGAALRH